ncbi:MAG: ribosome biogenesis GTPase YlqF [Dethiobacteria bacterium]
MNRKNINHGSARHLKEIEEQIKAVNYVIEVLDARAPQSSSNPALGKIIGKIQKIIVLNKSDLADPKITDKWLYYYKKEGMSALSFSIRHPASTIFSILDRLNAHSKRTRFRCPHRILVAGIPNVGKSTIINSLLRRKAAKTGDRPGITRGRQWIRLKEGWELLDTVGIIQPFVNDKTFNVLASLGVLEDSQFDPLEVTDWLLQESGIEGFKEGIGRRFGDRIPDGALHTDEILGWIGSRRGCLKAGGEIDLNQAAHILLKEYRDGLLGRYSMELPVNL